jgi:hypothetical protein
MSSESTCKSLFGEQSKKLIFRVHIPSGAKQVAEKGLSLIEHCEVHTSGAKALVDPAGFDTGDKSPAYRPNEFFRNL